MPAGGSRIRMPIVDRVEYLARLCREPGDVVHVGCTDSPFTAERLEQGELLHASLLDVADVDGLDVDAEAIAILRQRFPGRQFAVADVSGEVPDELCGAYDLVVAGEVLEHVPGIGAFLRGCRGLLRPQGRICVTVPNAVSPKAGARSLVGREVVHPDHFVYFGPLTLRRALAYAGFEVEAEATYFSTRDPLGRTVDVLSRLSHLLFRGPVGDGLIATARRRD
jgi:2-polyprenyl-3-methyl-5-hydroxy-6-metoxy-1,4-benzoquinol methylase